LRGEGKGSKAEGGEEGEAGEGHGCSSLA